MIDYDIRGSVVQIFDHEDPLRSDTTLFIAALFTLGVPLAAPTHCTYELVKGETVFRVVWTLRSESPGSRFATRLLQKEWFMPEKRTLPPEHPIFVLRNDLTYERAFGYTPKFTPQELAKIEKPETWLEAGIINLLTIMREIPRMSPEGIVRFGPRHVAMVPRHLAEPAKVRFLKYVEFPSKRGEILASS